MNRQVLGIRDKNGVMAEYITLPEGNLLKVPENVSSKEAVLTEPLAAAFRITEQIDFQPGLSIAVIGDGKLGLLIAEVIRLQPKTSLTIFGRHAKKMTKVKDVNSVVVSKEAEQVLHEEQLKEYENNFDIVVEATGSLNGLNMAGRICMPLGKVILKTTCAGGVEGFQSSLFVIKEIAVIGSRCGDMKVALNAMEKKKVDVTKYISAEYRLQEAAAAFQRVKRGSLHILLRS